MAEPHIRITRDPAWYASRLTAHDIGADGGLGSPVGVAETPGDHPDGICIDAEGAVWYAESMCCADVAHLGAQSAAGIAGHGNRLGSRSVQVLYELED